jgi:hypothetical protein
MREDFTRALRPATLLASVMSIAAIASGCGGSSTTTVVSTPTGASGVQGTTTGTAPTLPASAASSVCLQSSDLPSGYLPLHGEENMSNELQYGLPGVPKDLAKQALEASWLVLPKGGAGPSDKTASCTVDIFTSAETAQQVYQAYVQSYGSESSPKPKEQPLPDGVPGTDPHLYRTDTLGGRTTYTLTFLTGNALLNVNVDGTDVSPDDVVTLATAVEQHITDSAG